MEKTKIGHPILGIVLGLIAIAVSIFFTFATGVIGGGIALVLAVIGICLGVSAKKKGGKGLGAILVGIIAGVMAVLLTFTSVTAIAGLRDQAKELKPDSLFAQYATKPYLGAIGIIMNMPNDQGSLEALQQELQEFSAQIAETEAK